MINKRLERQEIERLLPWHAAGTLNRREADLVERALAGDTELAQRYDLVRQELAETIHLNETLGAPSERQQFRLFAHCAYRESNWKHTWPGIVVKSICCMCVTPCEVI